MTRATKIVATIAVVGAVAAVAALFGMNSDSPIAHRLLQATEDSQTTAQFQQYLNEYNKNYLTKGEYAERLAAFKSNLDLIKTQNAKNEGFVLGLNQFSDLTSAEFNKLNGFQAPLEAGFLDTNEDEEGQVQLLGAGLTANAPINWVTKGAVSAVKNQGSCGGCYSFSAVGALEGAYAIKNNKLNAVQEFSEQ